MIIKECRKIVIVVTAIVAIVFLFDVVVGYFSRALILNVHDVGVNQTNAVQAMFKRKADVLILGPSSANHHYNSKLMEDSLKLNVYNAGRDGQNMVYAATVFMAMNERYRPKKVVLDMSGVMLNGEWNSHLSDLNCYYGISERVDSIIDDIGTWEDRLKLKMNLYRYNNTLPWIVNGYLSPSKKEFNGYRPMPVEKSGVRPTFTNNHFKPDELDMRYFEMLISQCKNNGIKLVCVSSPSMNIDKSNFHVFLRKYLDNRNVDYYDFDGDSTYVNHPELFYDMSHLNANGADVFTNNLIKYLR